MNKIYIIAISLAATACLSSCFNKVESFFDQPSDERLSAKTEECRKLLTQAEYGWVIQYYPSTIREFGGSNFVAKFGTDGNVTVSSDVTGNPADFVKSHYSLKNSQSVVLSFDTYNDYIHSWSDPDPTKSNKYGGDFEWVYIEGDSEKMVFKGVKTGNTIIFKALQEDMLVAIRKIVDIRINSYLNINYIWDDGSQNGFEIKFDDDYAVINYKDANDIDVKLPFIYTQTGIRFYEPTKINGVVFSELTYDADAWTFTADAKDEDGQNIVWQGKRKAGITPYESFIGTWDIVFRLSENEYTRRVTIVQQQKNRSYTMKGLYRDLKIVYDKTKSPKLFSQIAEATSTSSIMFCMWDNLTNFSSSSDMDGVYLNYTVESGNIFLTMENIGGFNATGFLFLDQYTGNDQLQDTPNIQYFIKR